MTNPYIEKLVDMVDGAFRVENGGENYRDGKRLAVRTILSAMREPSQQMLDATAHDGKWAFDANPEQWAIGVWRSMLDAALAEAPATTPAETPSHPA